MLGGFQKQSVCHKQYLFYKMRSVSGEHYSQLQAAEWHNFLILTDIKAKTHLLLQMIYAVL